MSSLPIGAIIMFSGKNIPAGWLLCNGENGTPNLVDKFILGGQVKDVGGEGGGSISGEKNNKTKLVTTTQSATGITIQTKDTTLSIEQIPSHTHSTSVNIDSGNNNNFWGASGSSSNGHKYQGIGITNQWNDFPIRNSGGNKGHSHDSLISDEKHNHSVDVILPYFVLAYIQYVGDLTLNSN